SQSNEQLLASTSRSQLKKLVVRGGMNASLAAPPLAIGSERPEQSLRVLHVARDVVIPQDDHLAGKGGVLPRDSIHGALAHLTLIHDDLSAEIATVRAAARGKQNSTGMIAAMKQVLARHRRMFQRRRVGGTVPGAMAARFEVAQELRPGGFSFADEDYVPVGLRFVRHQRHSMSRQNHRNTQPLARG